MAGRPAFLYQACLYHSVDEFLATAVTFIEDGLAGGEPALAVTTLANLDLLNAALGERARGLDYAETASFGRRPPQRVAAFDRYWKHAWTGRVGSGSSPSRPGWAGRSGTYGRGSR